MLNTGWFIKYVQWTQQKYKYKQTYSHPTEMFTQRMFPLVNALERLPFLVLLNNSLPNLAKMCWLKWVCFSERVNDPAKALAHKWLQCASHTHTHTTFCLTTNLNCTACILDVSLDVRCVLFGYVCNIICRGTNNIITVWIIIIKVVPGCTRCNHFTFNR